MLKRGKGNSIMSRAIVLSRVLPHDSTQPVMVIQKKSLVVGAGIAPPQNEHLHHDDETGFMEGRLLPSFR